MRRRYDLADRWRAEVSETRLYDHPHGTVVWPQLMHTLGAEPGHLMWLCQKLPSPQRRRPLLELARWAAELGMSRPARRMFYEMAIPQGWTHYLLTLAPRPRSEKAMTTETLRQFKLSKSIALNRRIAAEILHRHEQDKSIRDAAGDIADEGLFSDFDQDALVKRWQQWRKWAEGFGSHYRLTGTSGSRYVTPVIDCALPFTPDAKPLPPAAGGRPAGRANTI